MNELMEEVEQKEGYKVTDLSTATWAMRKLSKIESEIKEVKELSAAEHSRIEEWETARVKGLSESQDYFKHLLGTYLLEEKQKDPKFKLSTPYGNVSTRKKPDAWEYDEQGIVPFLKEHEMLDFVKVKETIDKTAFKKAVQVMPDGRVVNDDGIVIDCVKVVPQGESVVFKIQ